MSKRWPASCFGDITYIATADGWLYLAVLLDLYSKHLYKERHLVECFINKIRHYRRIFSRFDKLAS